MASRDRVGLLTLGTLFVAVLGFAVWHFCKPVLAPKVPDLAELRALEQDPTLYASRSKLRTYLGSLRQLADQERLAKGYVSEPLRERVSYFEALAWYLDVRCYPNDTFDQELYDMAAKQREEMAREAPVMRATWEFVGPINLKVPNNKQYFGVGPLGGRINCIAYHPTDSKTYWVGSPTGGLWKTTDDGSTWTPISDQWTYLGVSWIELKPGDPDTIYVGTGDYHGRRPPYSFGIRKTTNGGVTWSTIFAAESAKNMISRVCVLPSDPNVVLVSTGRGKGFSRPSGVVYRSEDGGSAWTRVLDKDSSGTAVPDADWSNVTYSAVSQTTGRRYVYASGEAKKNGLLYRSDDYGKTWKKLTLPDSFAEGDHLDCVYVCTSVVDSETVYLMRARRAFGGENKGTWKARCAIFKSTKAGATGSWVNIATAGRDFPIDEPDGSGGVAEEGYNWSQCNYDYQLTATYKLKGGKRYDVLYCGLITLAQYDGETDMWRDIGESYIPNDKSKLHNDQHSCAVFPGDPSKVLIGCDGGLFRAEYDDVNDEWSFAPLNGGNKGLFVAEFYNADWHPTDKDMAIGGTQDNASPAAVLNGAVSKDPWSNVSGGDGNFAAIDPKDPKKQYSVNNATSFRRTDDLWKTQATFARPPNIGPRRQFVGVIGIDPTDPNYLYYVSNYLHGWKNSESTWKYDRILNQEISATESGTAVTVAPSNSNIVFTGSLDGEIWRFEYRRGKWDNATAVHKGKNAAKSLPNLPVMCIAVHPTDPKKIYVALGGTPFRRVGPPVTKERIWMCADVTKAQADREWIPISGSGGTKLDKIPAFWIALDPDFPDNIFYVGTDLGFYYTLNGGTNYFNGGLGQLPNVGIATVKVRKYAPNDKWIHVATFGRGIWRIKFEG